jgi:hypothetical protein
MAKEKEILRKVIHPASKHQSIIDEIDVYDENGEYLRTEKRWNMPKFITSDVQFQLIFGFKYPKENWRTPQIGQSHHLPSQYSKK